MSEIEANNFNINNSYVNLVQMSIIEEKSNENLQIHLNKFKSTCNVIKVNGVTSDDLRLHLFPIFLGERLQSWLKLLETGSITNWTQMIKTFLAKYFPPAKTTQYRSRITSFKQKDEESLSDTYDRFKNLEREYPHHKLEKWLRL